jgi:hypothetical protein
MRVDKGPLDADHRTDPGSAGGFASITRLDPQGSERPTLTVRKRRRAGTPATGLTPHLHRRHRRPRTHASGHPDGGLPGGCKEGSPWSGDWPLVGYCFALSGNILALSLVAVRRHRRICWAAPQESTLIRRDVGDAAISMTPHLRASRRRLSVCPDVVHNATSRATRNPASTLPSRLLQVIRRHVVRRPASRATATTRGLRDLKPQ